MILFFQWQSFLNKGIEKALKRMNRTYEVFEYQFIDWEKDEIFCNQFRAWLKSHSYEIVLSVNYSPLISNICESMKLPYVSWIYDSPIHIRDLSSLKNKCNRMYFFDRGQAEGYRKQGIDARYMQLAADPIVFAETAPLLSEKERADYMCDVSLVGKLYQTEYQYYSGPLDAYQRGYLEGIIQSQMKLYGGYLLPELISDEFLESLNERYGAASNGAASITREELEFMLACEVTGRERYLALALLSNHFKVNLYSNNRDERLNRVNYKGYADYYTQMPQIFRYSKINLNISLKTIQTGIPLRVLDVLACGGFLLTNYQIELPEYFEIGRDLVVYENLEDMYRKVDYYLKHEAERRQIAENGYRKVCQQFPFDDKLEEMFKI